MLDQAHQQHTGLSGNYSKYWIGNEKCVQGLIASLKRGIDSHVLQSAWKRLVLHTTTDYNCHTFWCGQNKMWLIFSDWNLIDHQAITV